MAIGDEFKLRVQFTNELTATTAEIDLAFQQNSAIVATTPAADLIQAFQTEAQPELLACISERWHLVRYAVHALPSGLLVGELLGSTVIGSLTGEMMPVQIAGLLTHRTNVLGRSGRGRSYLPTPNEVSSSNGAPSGAYITLMDAFGAALLSMFTPTAGHAGWTLGVWSPTLTQFNQVITITPRPGFATQRLRTR